MRNFWKATVALQLIALPALAQSVPTSPNQADTKAPMTTTAPVTQAPNTMSGAVAVPDKMAPSSRTAVTTPAMPSSADDKAVSDTGTAGGLRGANSFTEAQARSRLEKNGFGDVSGLSKSDDGIWRGTASKGGTKHAVGVDFKGNIITD